MAQGQRVSALRWGSGDPDIVFLHGRGQNAHTWDLVALALRRPALAVDLPGHGHSDWRGDGDYWPWRNAEALQWVLAELAPAPVAVVGMSLGGLTGIRLARLRRDLVRALVVVDVTPGVLARTEAMTAEQRGATALISGPPRFPSLDDMVELAVQASPRRPASAVRRGVVHNARQLPDGSWAWRYDSFGGREGRPPEFAPLWDDVAALDVPTMLVRVRGVGVRHGAGRRALREPPAECPLRDRARRGPLRAERPTAGPGRARRHVPPGRRPGLTRPPPNCRLTPALYAV